MFKDWIICISAMLITSVSFAQTNIKEFNQQRLKKEQIGMYVLGGWSAGNILANGTLLLVDPEVDDATSYFRQMNIYWNIVNGAIAGFALRNIKREGQQSLSEMETIKAQHKLEKAFLFNTGLDVAYVAIGAYMRERSLSSDSNEALLEGFGRSIMLQGAFLFVFDLSMYLVHRSHGKSLEGLLSNLAFTGNGFSYRIALN